MRHPLSCPFCGLVSCTDLVFMELKSLTDANLFKIAHENPGSQNENSINKFRACNRSGLRA